MNLQMKTTYWIYIVVVAAIAMVSARLAGLDTIAVASKMIASTGFVGVAVTAGAFQSRYGRIVVAALLLSWIGDLLLAGESERHFLFGLVSFLLAHVAYVIAFYVRGLDRNWVIVAFVPIALISAGVSAWLSGYLPADMLIPVRIYTVVISLMVIAALGTIGRGAPILVAFGALLFYFSDLSVAAGQFVQPDFPNYAWGLPFYFGGQVLLALSVRYSISESGDSE